MFKFLIENLRYYWFSNKKKGIEKKHLENIRIFQFKIQPDTQTQPMYLFFFVNENIVYRNRNLLIYYNGYYTLYLYSTFDLCGKYISIHCESSTTHSFTAIFKFKRDF